MFLKYFHIILSGLLRVHLMKVIPTNHSDFSDVSAVSQCVIDIIDQYNICKTTIVSANGKGKHSISIDITTNIAECMVVKGIPMTYIIHNVSNDKEANYVYEENSMIVTYIETCKSLIHVTNISFNKYNKYLIILPEILFTECNDSFKTIARKVAMHAVTFIYEDKTLNVFKLATYVNVLDPETCKFKNNLTQLNICRHGSIEETNVKVFPLKKNKDWLKCPMNVGLGSLYPYSKSYNKTYQNLDIVKMADGSDVEILKIVADYFNASLSLYHIKTDAENIHLELSYIPYILNGSLEVCIGGLYRVYGDIVSYSGIYSRQEIIWVYTVERNTESWMSFLKRISSIYVFIIFYICYTVTWCIFYYYDESIIPFTNTLFKAWGALFGAASLQHARSIKQKTLNFFYLILCLHLTAYMNTQLFSFLTIQGPPRVHKDISELSESGKPLYMVDKAKYFVDDEKYITFVNTSQSCSDFDDCIRKTLDNKGGTVIADGLLAYVQATTAVGGEARILKATNEILFVYHEMIIWKESLLLGRFEKVIERLFEAGICEKLYEDSIGILVIDKARRGIQNIMSNSYSCKVGCKITLSQCAGAFYAWILGCFLACCIFCSEIVISREKVYIKSL